MNTPFENAEFTRAVVRAQEALGHFAETNGADVESVSQTFKQLAFEADTVLRRAASILDDVSAEKFEAVLSHLREHCLKSREFQERRLGAAETISQNVATEIGLLRRVTSIASRQEHIAGHMKALSMLTNIEAIHISIGESEFRLLAQELSAFSSSLQRQTFELADYTERHKKNTLEIWAHVSSDLPRLKAEKQEMEDDLNAAVNSIDTGLGQLCSIPEQFNRSARHTADQISGVIAAVQAHDITRQQIEHVQQSLALVLSRIGTTAPSQNAAWPLIHGGLSIQTGQLKMIKGIVTAWISQITTCMNEISNLSSEEVVRVPAVLLKQWSELSTQLTRLETLEQESQKYGIAIQRTFQGFADLKSLVEKHLQDSKLICDRLRLLTFNSLIEAHNIGAKGRGVSAIARLIRELALDWTGITDEFQDSLEQIATIYEGMQQFTGIFSDPHSGQIVDEQAQTRTALEHIDRVARFVADVAKEMQSVTSQMRSDVNHFQTTTQRLSSAIAHIDSSQAQVEDTICRLEKCYPQIASDYKLSVIEELFGSFYTTESETEVMNAVLHGKTIALPMQSITGNAVELF